MASIEASGTLDKRSLLEHRGRARWANAQHAGSRHSKRRRIVGSGERLSCSTMSTSGAGAAVSEFRSSLSSARAIAAGKNVAGHEDVRSPVV